MGQFFVYILKCSDGSLYTGWTTDLERRLRVHNSGLASKYTRVRLPVRLVYFEPQLSKSAAMSAEARIKSLRRAEKMAIIAKGLLAKGTLEK